MHRHWSLYFNESLVLCIGTLVDFNVMVIFDVRFINLPPFRPYQIISASSRRNHTHCKTLEVLCCRDCYAGHFVRDLEGVNYLFIFFEGPRLLGFVSSFSVATRLYLHLHHPKLEPVVKGIFKLCSSDYCVTLKNPKGNSDFKWYYF